MKVRDIMTSESLATASLDTTLQEIANMMKDENVGAIPILDEDENLAGIITDRDIVIRAVAEGQDTSECTAEEILSEELHTIEPDVDIEQAADLMARHKIRRLPVVEDGEIVGMISLGDISVKAEEDQAGDVLEDISEGVKEAGSTPRVSSWDRSENRTSSGSDSRDQEREGKSEGRGVARAVKGESSNQRRGEVRGQDRGETRGQPRSENRGATQRAGSADSQFNAAGRRSPGEQVAADEAEYQRRGQDTRINVQEGGSRSEHANAGRIRNQSRSQQSVVNDLVDVEGEEEFEFENAGGGNPRQRANQQQAGVRGRQNTSARGRDSGQVRGEDTRRQGVSNRTSSEERSRQQKVAPMRAEASNPARNRGKKRAS